MVTYSDLLQPKEPVRLRAPLGVEPPVERAPTWGDTFTAAFDRENVVVNLYRNAMEADNQPIKGYSAFNEIKDTPYEANFADRFAYSRSPKDTEMIKARIDRETKNNEVLAASGGAGLVASMVAGITDPTLLLPGGALYKAKQGYSALRSALSIGTAGAAQVALQESLLQGVQETRTTGESVINVGTATLLTAILGAGAARFLTRGERLAMERALDGERKALAQGPIVSGGAAAADARTAELSSFVPPVVARGYEAVKRGLEKAGEKLGEIPIIGGVAGAIPRGAKAIMEVPEKIALRGNPFMRSMTAQSVEARRVMLDLADSPLLTKDAEEGIAASIHGIPLEREVKMTVDRAQADLYRSFNQLYADYSRGDPNKMFPAARSYLEQKFGRSDVLGFEDWKREVDVALRNGDVHEVPQVAAAAKVVRKWLDVGKKLAQELGIDIGDDVLGAASFAPRVPNRIELARQRPLFLERATNWLKGDQAQKAALKEELSREFEIFQSGGADATSSLSRIEDLLMRWQGRSAKAAQKAIGDRKASKAGEEIGPPGTLSPEVQKAIQAILKSDRDLSEQELRSEAERIFSNYMSTPDGRLPDDAPGTMQKGFSETQEMGELRGSLNRRRNPMPDNDLLPFLVQDPIFYTLRYLKQTISDLGMVSRWGDSDMTEAFKKIEADYNRLMDTAETPEQREAMLAEYQSVVRDTAAIRDRIKGVYGFTPEGFMRDAGRIAESLKYHNLGSLAGGFGISQLPDFAGVIFRHGLTKAFRDGFIPFFANLTKTGGAGFKAAKREYAAFGLGQEMYQLSHHLQDVGVSDVNFHHSPLENALRATGKATVLLSGAPLMTDAAKTISAVVAGNEIIRASKAIAEGKAKPKQIRDLAAANITEDRAERIWAEFQKGGAIVDGTFVPNLADWADQDAARFFEAAVMRDVEIAVVTPGQEKALFLSQPIMSLLGQFKSFVASSTTRILLANLQRRDATTLSGLVATVALGMTGYAAYTVARGGQLHDRPQDWVKEGIDRSGIMGWFSEANNMASKATGGQADLYRLIGADKPLSRYVSRGLVGNILGPTFGLAEDAAGITYAASKGEWTEGDTRKLRRMLPFQNLFYLRRLFDEVEGRGNAAFGIEPRAANGR